MGLLLEVENVLQREARCLDLRKWDEWLALYTDDCEYWIPAQCGQTSGKTHVSLFREDRVLMETRVKRLLHPAAHSLVKPLRTSHVVGGVVIESEIEACGQIVATSSFHMLEQHGERQRLFGGVYTHRLLRAIDGLRIQAKRVDLTNCDMPLEVIETFI